MAKARTQKDLHKLLEEVRGRMNGERPETARNVFTISGTPGAGTSEITAIIARKLGLDVYDKDIVQQLAQLSGTTEEAIKVVSDDSGDAKGFWLYRMFGGGSVTNEEIQRNLVNLFYALAAIGNCIIVGRGAHVPLAGLADLRIRITGSRANGVARIASREKVGKEEADNLYNKRLSSAGRFVWNVFGTRLNEPVNFDVVVNTDYHDDFEYIADALIDMAKHNAKAQK